MTPVHIPMTIFKMSNTDYSKIRHILDGFAFHRPLDDDNYEMKFITRKIEKQFLEIFTKNNISIEDTGRKE